MLDICGPALGTVAVGLVTGVAMAKSGLALPVVLAISLLVFSSAPQLASLPLIAAGAPVWVIFATACALNMRFIVFSAHWRPYFAHLARGRRAGLAYLAGDPILAPLLDADRPLVPVARENIHVVGARSIDPGERDRLRAHGIDCVDMRHIDERGVCALMEERIARWAERGVHLHLSLDLDCLDPSVAPGTGTMVPGGATYREAHLIMEMLSDSGLVRSMDLVELNPFLDERGKSAVVAVELIASVFGRTVLDRLPNARRFADVPAARL